MWLEEFAAPYAKFLEVGYDVTVTSILGGQAPLGALRPIIERSFPRGHFMSDCVLLDPSSLPKTDEEKAKNAKSIEALHNTIKLSTIIDRSHFDAVFFPGMALNDLQASS